jgi:hypothetical protein
MVVLAVVVLPLVETVVVALVLPDFVVTVFVDVEADLVAASAGVATRATAATDAISFFILVLLGLPVTPANDPNRRAALSSRWIGC